MRFGLGQNNLDNFDDSKHRYKPSILYIVHLDNLYTEFVMARGILHTIHDRENKYRHHCFFKNKLIKI